MERSEYIGSKTTGAKLTWQQALEIIQMRASVEGKRVSPEHPASIASLCALYGVSAHTISKIANHQSSYSREIERNVRG